MINEAVKTEVQMQFTANAGSIWSSIQRQVKRAAIVQIMHETRNNQSAAAQALGISRITLRSWIEDKYWCEEGWYESNEFEDIHYGVDGVVTHWMPLPTPPPPEEFDRTKLW